MQKENQTVISEFLLLGFSSLRRFKYLLFATFFIFYMASITGNSLVIAIVSIGQSLHSPMYFFLRQLSIAEILFTTSIVPTLLSVVLQDGNTISISGCIVQFIMFSGLTNTECSILIMMSYDRYLAICKPLHYPMIMNNTLQLKLVIGSWIAGFITTLSVVLQMCGLQFCSPNVFDHYYCDIEPLLKHSCSNVPFLEMETVVFSTPLTIFPFVFIIVTYVRILFAIFNIPTNNGRQKVFSTCSSHMAVVCMYYGSLVTIYVVPSIGNTWNIKKFLSLLYTIATPFLNPIIYSIRNQEIRAAMQKHICRKIIMYI
ncbi:hypothetical protein XELAEV_18012469mg [Xenopus laevis]|uniref:Olfactory receptor n=1 Tax=Xenopus laevis TaxID=8355 RepID=A0A974DMQ9_XENLA|nr:hypothetical protein XELAEV_18012469mg [Xenopus laevis]